MEEHHIFEKFQMNRTPFPGFSRVDYNYKLNNLREILDSLKRKVGCYNSGIGIGFGNGEGIKSRNGD
jgi:hypothetical protein